MAVDSGVQWVILGHSERRHVFGESNEVNLPSLALGFISVMKEKMKEKLMASVHFFLFLFGNS